MHLVGLGKIAIKVTLNFQFYPRRPDWFVIIHEDPCIRTLLPMILINKHQTQKHYKAKENNSNSRTLSLIKGLHHYLVAVLLGCMQKEISSIMTWCCYLTPISMGKRIQSISLASLNRSARRSTKRRRR